MRKFLTLYFTPILATCIAIVKFPYIETELNNVSQGHGVLLSAVILIGAIWVNQLITVISPYKRYERYAKNRWYIIEQEAKPLVEKYQKVGIELKLNIMVPKIRFLCFLEPIRVFKWELRMPRFFAKVFEVVWVNGQNSVNQQLRLTTRQGVCGKAYTNADGVRGTEFVSGTSPKEFNFNKKQKEYTKDLKMVASVHIFQDGNTAEKKSNRVIGVLNCESDTPNSELLILDSAFRKVLFEDMYILSFISSKFI